jgi:hypothetical protein
VRQIIRVYGIDAGNQHHDNGVIWRTIDVYAYMFKDESVHVLRYFKCSVGSSSSEGTAAEVTSALPWTRTPGSKPDRTLPWTRTLGWVQSQSGS